MEQLFFSKSNFDIIYNILKNKIKGNTNVDIDTHPNFREELIKIIKTIYKQRNNFNIPSNMSNIDISRYLSQKVINISINYFTETISQNNNHTNRDIHNKSNVQKINQIDTRPQTTSQYNNGSSTVVNNFNKLLNERDQQPKTQPPPVNFKENIQESNNDIQNKYKDLNSKRESEYELLNKTSGNSNITQEPEFKNMMPSNTLAQQNLIDNPSSVQIQHLLQQQKQLQEQINKFQRQENTTNFSYNHPSQISMNNEGQAQQFKESQIKPIFNAPSQQNTQFLSDDNKPLTDILQSQFTALTSDRDNTMEPDRDIDYQNLLSDITDESVNLTDQFETAADGAESIFPKKPFDDTTDNVLVTNNENPNLELDIIKESIAKQSTAINNTHNNIEKLIQLYQENDISKYYQTIQDIPRLIQEQKKQPLTIRTHNLIVSSRDRNLGNKDFDKYNFRIVFGAEGSQTITTIKNDNDNLDINANAVESVTSDVFTSTGLQNPSVSQILKNVISIKLKRVIIPKPRDAYHFPEPYFFVAVDEFNSNIISTKNFNEKIFCKIHFDKELVYNNGIQEESRTYLYYKNDDDDFTIFYSSPLAKLDRLTLKLLDSEGINVKESAMKDIDINNPTNDGGATYTVSTDLYANTFIKDKLFIIPDNGAVQTHRVTAIDDSDANNIKITPGTYTPQTNDTIINLTNQVEYIFEIKTQEPDPTNSVRPTNI